MVGVPYEFGAWHVSTLLYCEITNKKNANLLIIELILEFHFFYFLKRE